MTQPASAPPRLGILLSGSGRTLQNLIDRIAAGTLSASIAGVLADRPDAFGLQRARAAGLPTLVERDPAAVWSWLRSLQVDLVCLCGYLRLLPIAPDFRDRVLNIHPALLPAFGGKGMWGHHVHDAVLRAGEAESGCTVHLCTDEYDRGPIVLQKRVPVLPGDDAERLAARVFEAECEAYPQAIAQQWQRLTGAAR
jgi:phosphoribosylglycinamide formyltransferase 1